MLVAYFVDVEVPCTLKQNGETLRLQRYHSSKLNEKVFRRYSFYTWVQIMGVFGKGTKYGVVS